MKKFLFLLTAFILSSCSLFLSPYSAQSYKYFVELKVLHIKFIETFTQSDVNTYNRNDIDEFYNKVDLKFREAVEYQAQIAEDGTRLNAFNILNEEFKDNYNALIEDEELYDELYSQKTIKVVSDNYDNAIKGELSRRVAQ